MNREELFRKLQEKDFTVIHKPQDGNAELLGGKLILESVQIIADIAEQYAASKTGWVSVNERLPEKQGHYLVRVLNSYPKNCDCIVAEFYEDNKTFYCESSDYAIKDAIEWKSI
jgi:hypothetical protein